MMKMGFFTKLKLISQSLDDDPKNRLAGLTTVGNYLEQGGDVSPFIGLLDVSASEKYEKTPIVRMCALSAIGKYIEAGGKADPFIRTLCAAASEKHESNVVVHGVALQVIEKNIRRNINDVNEFVKAGDLTKKDCEIIKDISQIVEEIRPLYNAHVSYAKEKMRVQNQNHGFCSDALQKAANSTAAQSAATVTTGTTPGQIARNSSKPEKNI